MSVLKENSEKVIERKLVAEIKKRKGMCIKLLCDQFSGLPDRMCLLPGGHVVFVELKSTGQKPRPLQIAVHNKLRTLGLRVEVIDTIEGVLNFIKDVEQDELT